ncbi:phosphoribosyl-AMP cyclohydrolase [Massilia glaciei]|uniref:Phosphoribosyl-AMP cyclohydrolase n=1 Tax=Massilia glaciei TaxID=1524097 RepID=A0A2U2HDK2_9BURK|nr:phosphoribosyl-AMP cyclohydrolase [Massilia glaciei]PWF41205.1 phosphoribosyl-AMP cyclohydrolase [Massilia glaciei]
MVNETGNAQTGNAPSAGNAKWLLKVNWDENGLVPVIAQEAGTKDVLMFAWMNRDALAKTVELGEAVYWSRSRRKLWHKGEESGHIQKVREIRFDCDEDVILLTIEQTGGIACHTGRHSCFYQKFEGDAASGDWVEADPVLRDPSTFYTPKTKKTP